MNLELIVLNLDWPSVFFTYGRLVGSSGNHSLIQDTSQWEIFLEGGDQQKSFVEYNIMNLRRAMITNSPLGCLRIKTATVTTEFAKKLRAQSNTFCSTNTMLAIEPYPNIPTQAYNVGWPALVWPSSVSPSSVSWGWSSVVFSFFSEHALWHPLFFGSAFNQVSFPSCLCHSLCLLTLICQSVQRYPFLLPWHHSMTIYLA